MSKLSRLTLATTFYIFFMIGFCVAGGDVRLSDDSKARLLILALSPFALVDVAIIRLRNQLSGLMLNQARMIAV